MKYKIYQNATKFFKILLNNFVFFENLLKNTKFTKFSRKTTFHVFAKIALNFKKFLLPIE